MDVTRIVAIRHGETSWNSNGRVQGHTDIALNERGLWQAAQMAQALQERNIDAIYSSDLMRTRQTAQALADAKGLGITFLPQWRERCFGEFEGKTFAQVQEQSPQEALHWRERSPDFAPAGGESLNQFQRRVLAALSALAAANTGKDIAIITHGGVLDVLYRHANGLSLAAARSWTIENTSINRFLWTPESFTVVGWADNAHLEGSAVYDEKFT